MSNFFNSYIYKKLNPELNDLSDEELKKHYFTKGIYERRECNYKIPDDFDSEMYAYLNNIENQSEEDLKIDYYIQSKSKKLEYTIDIPKDFDITIFKELNSELTSMNDKRLKCHYNLNQHLEYKLDLPKDFDVNNYRELNTDLKSFNDLKLKCHYHKLGKKEGRLYKYIIPKDFNLNMYRILNSDLESMNDDQLKNHYILFGKDENRRYKYNFPINFNIKMYRELNDDLKDLTDIQLQYHFINKGIEEKRPYKYKLPPDFNCEIYRKLNKDLVDLNDTQLKAHYIQYGIHEKREYNGIIILNNDDFSKLNFIDSISYILYFNCNKRKKYMKKILKDVDIGSNKIDSVNMTDLNKYILKNIDYEEKLSNYQLSKTLSHIKAINSLKEINKNYYMICEDNISFDGLKDSKYDLEKIITKAPKFDILILYKKDKLDLGNYVNWIEYYDNNLVNESDTLAYIISKSGVKKICKIALYEENSLTFNFNENYRFDKSYLYLFKYVNSYVYKFNFIEKY